MTMIEETPVYVDEYREPAAAPAHAHMVADPAIGVAFCVVDDLGFWIAVRQLDDGRVVLSGAPIEPDAAQVAAFFRVHPETRALQQPARGVRATSSGVLRLVK